MVLKPVSQYFPSSIAEGPVMTSPHLWPDLSLQSSTCFFIFSGIFNYLVVQQMDDGFPVPLFAHLYAAAVKGAV